MAVRSTRQRILIRSVAVFSTLLLIGFGASIAGLVKIQFVHGEEYRSKAQLNQLFDEIVPAQRGTIYDAGDNVLAKSGAAWKIYINPKSLAEINDEGMREELISKLSDILEVDPGFVRELTYKDNLEYAEVKDKVEFTEKEKVEALRQLKYKKNPNDENEKGISYKLVIGIRDDTKRYYPYGSFASSLIGFCGADGGSSGLERSYNSILTGTPGRVLTIKNAKNDVIPYQLETVYETKQGTSLVLTIDEKIQQYLEDGLEQVYKESKGAGAYGIVMDPNTGAILAIANKPDYDLNSPDTLTDQSLYEEISKIEDATVHKTELNKARLSQWNNFCITGTYEPGSVFKIVTASAAIEEKVWSMDEKFTCSGSITVAGQTYPCWKHEGHGTQDIKQGFVNSCNPFFIKVGQRLGAEKFFKYFEAFGFTEKTGIDLPSEVEPVEADEKESGTYHSLASLQNIINLSSSAFGQTFEVSPIQMITATSAIANGGKLMRPYVVAKELDEDGSTISVTEPYVRRQVVSETTAKTLTEMMEMVVTKGSGKYAQVAGYQVAGKTGTSEKIGKKGAYLASFTCFAPAEDARIAILIVVDEPVGDVGGGQIAAPVAGDIVEKTLKYMNIEPRYSEEELTRLNTKAPNLIGYKTQEAKEKLESLGFSVKVSGTGENVVFQYPDFSITLPKNGIVTLYTDEDYSMLKITVPNLLNLNITQAYNVAIAAGINMEVKGNPLGSGEFVSYKQDIEPSTEVNFGSKVVVYFKSNTVTSEIG